MSGKQKTVCGLQTGSDVYVREALTELASDFKSIAKALEQREHGWMENATV